MKLLLLFFLTTIATVQTATVAIDDITKYIGKTVTVCETVQNTFKTKEHQYSLLNLGGIYPNQKLTILIYEKHLKNFSYIPIEYLAGKNICVTGKVYLYNGKPQIQIKNESELVIN